jgi:hypothetical protein
MDVGLKILQKPPQKKEIVDHKVPIYKTSKPCTTSHAAMWNIYG